MCVRARVDLRAGADTCIRPQLLTAYPQALEHTRKLIYGQQRSMVCQYGKYQMVFFNCTPLCITVIATAAANTGQSQVPDSRMIGSIIGAILDLRKDLELIVEEISAVLSDHLPKDT